MSRLLAAVSLLLAFAPGLAQAELLTDPTRPPPQLLQPMPGAADKASLAGPQLQSVLISAQAGGRKVAVIDGETVRLGQMYKGATLVRVTDTEVELLRGRERRVLKLFAPAVPAAVVR